MIDRGQQLLRYQFELPAFDASFFPMLMRWLIVVVAVAAVWLISGLVGSRTATGGGSVGRTSQVATKRIVRTAWRT